MAWGGWGTDLHVFNGRLTGQQKNHLQKRYGQLQLHRTKNVYLFGGLHRTRLVLQSFDELYVTHFALPSTFTSLNPKEHVLDMPQRQLNNHISYPRTLKPVIH